MPHGRLWLNGTEGAPPSSVGEPSLPLARGSDAGMHVLLVEDEAIIALDTESMLRELGAADVRSFSTAHAALDWLAEGRTDIGVLDIALREMTSYPVGDALVERGIPFIFTTGYGNTCHVPSRFAAVPVVHKPYSLGDLTSGLARCLAPQRGS